MIINNLPPTWELRSLEEISQRIMVGIASAATHAYRDKGITLLRNLNIKENKIKSKELLFLDPEYERSHKNKRLITGDIITVRTGYPGISAVVPDQFNNQQCFTSLITRPNHKIVNSHFIAYFLNSPYGKAFFSSSEAGGAQKNVNASVLSKIQIPVPPLDEQKKIVDILSSWDRFIENLEHKIELKRRQRKAIFFELITGKRRVSRDFYSLEYNKSHFYNYPKDWKNIKIGDFASEISIRNGNQDNEVLSCTKYEGFVDSLIYFGKKVFSDDTSNYKVIKKNQFGFPSNHVEEGSIGLLRHREIGIVSPIYVIFEVDATTILPEYLFVLLKTDTYRHIFSISTNSSVDRRGSLRWKEFSQIKVPLPSIREQEKILKIIRLMNNELVKLTEIKTLYKSQKKGLMEKLLLGEVRVSL